MPDPQSPVAENLENLLTLVKDYNNFQNIGGYWEFGYDVGTGWKKLGVVTAGHAELLQGLKLELAKHLSFDTMDAEQKPCHRIRLHADHLKDSDAFVKGIRNIRNILCPKESRQTNKNFGAVWNDPNEMWPLYGITKSPYGFVCGLSPVFGIVTTGVHLNIYKRDANDSNKLWIFVAKRSDEKRTFSGMYDQCAAGGYQYACKSFGKANDTSAKECLKREVKEELTSSLSRRWLNDVKEASPIQFAVLRDERWGEDFLGAPELGVKIPFDLEVKEDPIFKPNPDEVESVEKKSVGEIVKDLLDRKFKPNSALVMIDFLIRHGCLGEISPGEILDEMNKMLQKHEIVNGLPHWSDVKS
ncbi:thiamine pyrophosphokinase [Colletotrichum melonis]|uniref:Thiamine pyrophosphokinase n=2 Tax=Colletotrichum acutatum species complex TaxID=2707335 RepID=A0AAI9U0S2_9PEZI|nr:thiamine pyrophosphokinase [Colletotrichum limetticola]KAK1449458.1 thiamine pyrophosphokinase [Colletotrichum melonis]